MDDDFRDIYQRIGVDVPVDDPDDNENENHPRDKQKAVENHRFVFSLQSGVRQSRCLIMIFLVMLMMKNKLRSMFHLKVKHAKGGQ